MLAQKAHVNFGLFLQQVALLDHSYRSKVSLLLMQCIRIICAKLLDFGSNGGLYDGDFT